MRVWLMTAICCSCAPSATTENQKVPWEATSTEEKAWTLVFADEFNATTVSAPDPKKWTHDVGGDGWGNDQLEYDTNRIENAQQNGDGFLEIIALKEDYAGREYTSARLKSQGLFEVEYGKIEARIRLPEGNGLWPAFWMLGANFGTVGWPSCGEIDILEARGSQPQIVHGTVHGPGYSGGNGRGGSFVSPGTSFTDDFHVFTLIKERERLQWLVDGEPYFEMLPSLLPPEAEGWVFDQPFFLILNLAIGGHFLEPPDASTPFPAKVEVDWVRVYEQS